MLNVGFVAQTGAGMTWFVCLPRARVHEHNSSTTVQHNVDSILLRAIIVLFQEYVLQRSFSITVLVSSQAVLL